MKAKEFTNKELLTNDESKYVQLAEHYRAVGTLTEAGFRQLLKLIFTNKERARAMLHEAITRTP